MIFDIAYGVHTFLESAKERGIRPIIGAALTCPQENIENRAGSVYCFVENRMGFSRCVKY